MKNIISRIMPTKLPQFITISNNSGKAWPNKICEFSNILLCNFAPPTGGVKPRPQSRRKIKLSLWHKFGQYLHRRLSEDSS
jgi:hypothetical protein